MFTMIRTRLVREAVIARGIRSFTMTRVAEDKMKVEHEFGTDLYKVDKRGEILSVIPA
jgi:hypothetical protein